MVLAEGVEVGSGRGTSVAWDQLMSNTWGIAYVLSPNSLAILAKRKKQGRERRTGRGILARR